MTDHNHLFDPREVEKQVDQLSSTSGETFGTSRPDQHFLHDLRLVLAATEDDAQSEADEYILTSAWARIAATGRLSQNTMQRAHPSAHHRRFTIMPTLSSMPDQQVTKRGSFKRLLTTLAAVLVALALVGTLALFAMASHAQQPNTGTGSPRHPASPQTTQPGAKNYTYHQVGQEPVYDIEWSFDGARIVSANENVTSWDAFSGSHELKYTGSSAQKPQILFSQLSPDGKTVAVWNVGQIDLYNAATGKHLKSLTYPFKQTPGVKFNLPSFSPYISWSADGKFIRALAGFPTASNSRTNKLVTFEVATGAHQDLSLSLSGLLDHIAWSPNGQYLAVGRPAEGIVSVLKVANGQIVSSLHMGAPIETIPVNWSPDSSKLIADFGDNSGLCIWDAATAKKVITYQRGTAPAWSPNGKYIAVINQATIKILNASTGAVVHTYSDPASSGYAVVAWAPDSTAIAAGGASASGKGGVVSVWKITF